MIKILLFGLLVFLNAYSAEVDMRYFEPQTQKQFLDDITSEIASQADPQAQQLQRTLLEKIATLDTHKASIDFALITWNTTSDITTSYVMLEHIVLTEQQQDVVIHV
jgi:uncharacterized protein YejL (UPF0352 family)